MCGIIGLYGDDTNINAHKKKDFILEGALADSVRGYESTGIFAVPRSKKEQTRVYKRALAGFDFMQLKQTHKIVDQMSSSIAMVVHNRAATRGNVFDGNAHPFRFGNITLVHNGTVNNAFQLVASKDRPDHVQVDSAAVCHAFNHESAEDMLPRLQGGYSLIWHDAFDNTFHMARNDAKPMFICFDSSKEVMYFGSELKLILWLADRNDISLQEQVFSTTPHVHYVWKDPRKVREIEKRPFAPGRTSTVMVPPANTSSTPQTTTTTKTTEVIPWEPTPTTLSKEGTGTDHPILKEKLQAVVADALDYVPGPKRVDVLKEMLASQGLQYGKNVIGVPKQWTPYESGHKKGESPRGAMLCYSHGDPDQKPIFQVFGVTLEQWQRDFPKGRIAVLEVTNFREKTEYRNIPVFVCRIAEGSSKKHADAAEKGDSSGEEDEFGPTGPDYILIGTSRKRRVHLDWYRGLTMGGCFNCESALPEHLAHTIHWIGNGDNTPLCEVCGGNEQILNAMAQVH